MVETKLSKTLLEALAEVERYSHPGCAPFWWRQASMKKLAAMGLVEAAWKAQWGKRPNARLPHVITDAGRAVLANSEDRS